MIANKPPPHTTRVAAAAFQMQDVFFVRLHKQDEVVVKSERGGVGKRGCAGGKRNISPLGKISYINYRICKLQCIWLYSQSDCTHNMFKLHTALFYSADTGSEESSSLDYYDLTGHNGTHFRTSVIVPMVWDPKLIQNMNFIHYLH